VDAAEVVTFSAEGSCRVIIFRCRLDAAGGLINRIEMNPSRPERQERLSLSFLDEYASRSRNAWTVIVFAKSSGIIDSLDCVCEAMTAPGMSAALPSARTT
jgi:hypothetical protein